MEEFGEAARQSHLVAYGRHRESEREGSHGDQHDRRRGAPELPW